MRIGVIPTVGPYLLPYALPAVIRDLPRAPVTIVEDLTDRLLSLVLERKLDAAMIATDPADRKLDSLALYDEPFLLVVAPDHPLAGRASVGPREIDPDAVLLLTDGHCLRDQAIALCGRGAGARAAGSDISATSLETLLHLAAAGYGVTLAPRLALEGRGGEARGSPPCRSPAARCVGAWRSLFGATQPGAMRSRASRRACAPQRQPGCARAQADRVGAAPKVSAAERRLSSREKPTRRIQLRVRPAPDPRGADAPHSRH